MGRRKERELTSQTELSIWPPTPTGPDLTARLTFIYESPDVDD